MVRAALGKATTFGGFSAVVLILSSCGFVSAINSNITTKGVLVHEGYSAVTVSHSPTLPGTNKTVTVSVTTSGLAPKTAADGSLDSSAVATPSLDPVQQQSDIAKDVWNTFPFSFDVLTVSIVGTNAITYSHAQLVSLLGPRPGGLDNQSLNQSVKSGMNSVYIVLGAIIAILIIEVIRHELHHRSVHKDRMNEEHMYAAHYDPVQHLHAGVAQDTYSHSSEYLHSATTGQGYPSGTDHLASHGYNPAPAIHGGEEFFAGSQHHMGIEHQPVAVQPAYVPAPHQGDQAGGWGAAAYGQSG